MSSKENKSVTELSAAASNREGIQTELELDQIRKPFVEPLVSIPLDILDATAFFQGSAALDTIATN